MKVIFQWTKKWGCMEQNDNLLTLIHAQKHTHTDFCVFTHTQIGNYTHAQAKSWRGLKRE